MGNYGRQCDNECNKSTNWWDNQFSFNPSGYSDAPVIFIR